VTYLLDTNARIALINGAPSRVRARFEKASAAGEQIWISSIVAFDLLIAGQALRHRITLVTANVREFSRVKGLSWEDWGRS
jgi:predicted nucleic acid-binding protein